MNKIKFAMALICAGVFCMASVQASLFPPEIEKICSPVNAEKSDNCLKTQISYLDTLMTALYDKASEVSGHKELIEREQTIFEESRKSPGEEYYSLWDDYTWLVPRVLELAVSLYPEFVFPKDVIKACKQNRTEYQAEPRNCAVAFNFVKKSIEDNYKKALGSVRDPAALQANQQEWLRNSETFCEFGNIRDVWDQENDCRYYWNLLRAEELAAMAKEGKVFPSVLAMTPNEPNLESGGNGELKSYEGRLENQVVGSSVNKATPSEPLLDLTNVDNVKRIQIALSGIYKWIPTKSNDLAAMHYEAIHDFEERNGLPVSNKITQSLLLQLESAAAKQKQAGTEKIFLDFDSPKYIMKAQSLLREVGYAVPQNGILDQQTEDAIKDFQSRNGVKVSGKVGPFLIQQLENKAGTFNEAKLGAIKAPQAKEGQAVPRVLVSAPVVNKRAESADDLANSRLSLLKKPFLGIIRLGETDVTNLANILRARRCENIQVAADGVVIGQPCFDLPGNPTILALSLENPQSKIIDGILIQYSNSVSDPNASEQYKDALLSFYGSSPNSVASPDGREVLVWPLPELSVGYGPAIQQSEGLVAIMTPKAMEIFVSKSQEQSQSSKGSPTLSSGYLKPPYLGFLTLGDTTIESATKALENLKCQYKLTAKNHVEIDAKCFAVPNLLAASAEATYEPDSGKIDNIVFAFPADEKILSAHKTELDGLYGSAKQGTFLSKGKKPELLWGNDKVVVRMFEGTDKNDEAIAFMTPDVSNLTDSLMRGRNAPRPELNASQKEALRKNLVTAIVRPIVAEEFHDRIGIHYGAGNTHALDFAKDILAPSFGDMVAAHAQNIAKAYRDNEIKADFDYGDKWLLLDGKILAIEKLDGKPVLGLDSDRAPMALVAFFKEADKAIPRLMKLQRGENVFLICKGSAIMRDGSQEKMIGLKDCAFLDELENDIDQNMQNQIIQALDGKLIEPRYASLVATILEHERSFDGDEVSLCLASTEECQKVLMEYYKGARKIKDKSLPKEYFDLGYTEEMLKP